MRVLLTGAGGNLGGEALPHLLAAGHSVRAFDLPGTSTQRTLERYQGRVELCFGDLTNARDVAKAVEGVDAILHNGAVIPPLSERDPELAYRVNVTGTEHLVTTARAQPKPPRMLLASSIAVFGITQPACPPPRRADDPLTATDHYSSHKIECERVVRASGLSFCIMRIAVSPPLHPQRGDASMLAFMFERSLASRAEYVHPRDVGFAETRALEVDEAWGKVLLIGGGRRCQITYDELINGLLDRVGIGALPARAFSAQPLYGDYLDTEESERLLRFQRHTYGDYLDELTKNLGLARFGVTLLRPIARAYLLRHSAPYRAHAE